METGLSENSSLRLFTPSFLSTLLAWFFAVWVLTYKAWAISALEERRSISANTSRSLGVRRPWAGGPVDEASKDALLGGDGDDRIDVRNDPAVEDSVSCGSGFDRVTADSEDDVADDCESVNRL